jgi:hypothetical protein
MHGYLYSPAVPVEDKKKILSSSKKSPDSEFYKKIWSVSGFLNDPGR